MTILMFTNFLVFAFLCFVWNTSNGFNTGMKFLTFLLSLSNGFGFLHFSGIITLSASFRWI